MSWAISGGKSGTTSAAANRPFENCQIEQAKNRIADNRSLSRCQRHSRLWIVPGQIQPIVKSADRRRLPNTLADNLRISVVAHPEKQALPAFLFGFFLWHLER